MTALLCTQSRNSSAALHHVSRILYSTAAAKVKEVTSLVQWQETLKADSVVAQFTAQWCPPCKIIAPVMEEMAGQYPQVQFVKLDIDNAALREVVAEHNVAAVPTFVAYRSAQRGGSFSGADKVQLAAMVQQLAAKA